MTCEQTDILAVRLRTAFDLFDAGVALKRQHLRRENPHLSSGEIEALVVAWLRARPGAEEGDAEGRPVRWEAGELPS